MARVPTPACVSSDPPKDRRQIIRAPTLLRMTRRMMTQPFIRWNRSSLWRMTGTNCQTMRRPAGKIVAKWRVMPVRCIPLRYQYHSPGEDPLAKLLEALPAMLR